MSPWIRLRYLATCLAFLVFPWPAFGQQVITTFAGADWLFPGDGRPALEAPIGGLFSLDVATDRNGNYYICDADNGMVMRVGPDGIINVVAGNGLLTRSGDGGLAVNASLDTPLGIAVDAAGNLYIAEFGSHVRKVTPDGIIQSIAGTGEEGYSGDGGPATKARLNEPRGLAVDSANNLYIADTGNNVIRKVSPDGIITTVAGTGRAGYSGDGGPATSATLDFPIHVALDLAESLYIADSFNAAVRRVSGGVIDTFAGGGSNFGEGVPARQAGLIPLALATDSANNLYIVDLIVSGIRKVDANGRINTIAGNGTTGFAGDGGPALQASFNLISPGIALDASGNILIADQNRRVREITLDGNIQTVAGNGLYRFSGDGGPATSATLYLPTSVIADASGNVLFSETGQNRIRRVAPDGTISVYAGTGQQGYSGDGGPATQAAIAFPTYLGIGPDDNLYFSDAFNQAVRKIDQNGTITTFVDTGNSVFGSDARAHSQPYGIDFDGVGDLLIADRGTHRVLVVNPTATQGGVVAGTGQAGFSGDGGKATQAMLNHPAGLAFFNGAVYFCDSGNNRVRRIAASDLTITTVAGNGQAGYSGDGGQAVQASLNSPQGLTFDPAGNLYIADQGNNVVRRVAVDGTITTFAGSPAASSFGDGGPARNAFIGAPSDVSVDPAGNVLIAEFALSRIRQVLAAPPGFQISASNLAFTAPAGSSPVTQSVTLTGSIPGIPYTASVPAASPWLSVSPASGFMPVTLQITADPSMLPAGSNQASINITAPNASPPVQIISVALTVTAAGEPSLNVKPTSMGFSFVQQSPTRSRQLSVSNLGGGSLTASVAVTTTFGGPWLAASADVVTIAAFGSTSVNITADPTGLAPGTYAGTITVSSADLAQSVTVPVTMTVSAVPQTIRIPQTGLTFFAVQGGGPAPPQFFNILNTGLGQMRWSAQASTLSGGAWLSAFPANGVSDADSPLVPAVRLDVDPLALDPGVYAGTVQVSAPDADNTPQSASVFLNVLPPGSSIGPIVQPAAMIFAAAAGGESPGSQSVLVQSLSTTPVTFRSGSVTSDSQNWITTLPHDGTVTAAQPLRIVIQPDIQKLDPGIHRGAVTLSFSDGNTRNIAIVLVIVPSGSAVPSSVSFRDAQAACTPTTLAPVFTLLSDGFTVPAGFPGALAVRVIDDCANPMTTGHVVVGFSNGDPPLSLLSLKDGNWTATWTPQNSTKSITVTANASIPEQNLTGQAQIKGGFLTFDTPPVIQAGRIVNAASYAFQGPVAPGSLITIFGSKLAQGDASADTIPLPINLAGSTVVLAGIATPLQHASDGQLTAIVPYDVAVNTDQQVIVTRGDSLSAPQPLTIAPAAPGIFTQDGSGQGQGLIMGVDASGAKSLADPAHPVMSGDAIVIYCTGLGKVDPPVPAGYPAPAAPASSTVIPVSVSVGGLDAKVSFSGLAPGSAGLYEVDAYVPADVSPGDQVPVVVTAAGLPSLPVTIAVR
ncbi:MAG TPA: hypothetical protein VEV17_07515 [Bryobacteraceae bacterium]|nr:hypothetical protein [Bryobacteraceae bacterium]